MRCCDRRLRAVLVVVFLAAACGDFESPTVPRLKNLELSVIGGDAQFALPGTEVEDSLRVRVTHRHLGNPIPGIEVVWSLISGSGGQLSAGHSITDEDGYASVALRVGAELGAHTVVAAFEGIWGVPPRLTSYATLRPEIEAIQPATASVGDTITITGRNFFVDAVDLNVVRLAGRRARVISATESQLRIIVPYCLPSRAVEATVGLGPIESEAFQVVVDAQPLTPIELDVGTGLMLEPRVSQSCIRIPVQPGGSRYLIVPQNVSKLPGHLGFQLVGVSDAGGPTFESVWPEPSTRPVPAASRLEVQLRNRENELLERIEGMDPTALAPLAVPPAAFALAPAVGHTRSFIAMSADFRPVSVTAVLQAVGERSLIYQDVRAPAGGLDAEGFQLLADRFDDPIYETTVEAFGQVSDIDRNGRIIILLTPSVNEMTRPDEEGFIAGYFSACDLLPDLGLLCPSNAAEIFYAFVPDPEGRFGRAHTAERVLNTLHIVLAHELQHMIHFNERAIRLRGAREDLWLMEGLAHTAEELVGEVFRQRNDPGTAALYETANRRRAALYLRDTGATTLFSHAGFGTLGERGAAWLFVSYLRGRFGDDILRQMTQTTLSGTENVDGATSATWQELLSDWLVAIYVDGAPELVGLDIEARYSFPQTDLRQTILDMATGEYALQWVHVDGGDFLLSGKYARGAGSFVIVEEAGRALNVMLSGADGHPFPPDTERQLTIFRLR